MRLACILILIAATGVIARAEPPRLVAFARQADGASTALLTIGVSGASGPVAVTVQLPPGWEGPTTLELVAPAIVELQVRARADAVPGLGTIVVRALGLERRAYVRAPGEHAGPAQRPGRLWLALVRR